MENKIIELYTDGSSLGNPGPSGLGYVIRYWESKKEGEPPVANNIEGSQGFKLSTNNRMEIMAGIYGIEYILELISVKMLNGVEKIQLSTDSKYFCDAVVRGWLDKWQQNNWITSSQTPVKNKDLWEKVVAVLNKLKQQNISLNISYIPGHQGYEFNELADKLCTAASNDSQNHMIDEVYESTMSKPAFGGYKKYNNYNNYKSYNK
jgi:ribonuclease HI